MTSIRAYIVITSVTFHTIQFLMFSAFFLKYYISFDGPLIELYRFDTDFTPSDFTLILFALTMFAKVSTTSSTHYIDKDVSSVAMRDILSVLILILWYLAIQLRAFFFVAITSASYFIALLSCHNELVAALLSYQNELVALFDRSVRGISWNQLVLLNANSGLIGMAIILSVYSFSAWMYYGLMYDNVSYFCALFMLITIELMYYDEVRHGRKSVHIKCIGSYFVIAFFCLEQFLTVYIPTVDRYIEYVTLLLFSLIHGAVKMWIWRRTQKDEVLTAIV
ncbi:hypothetical protein ACOME3_000957 [Neoechinorhynchus agilis]